MMDEYTKRIKTWLNARFNACDRAGVYIAHQPIYGFRKGHCEPWLVMRYIITLKIMRMLARLDFKSLLDVGGAEGFKAFVAMELFNVKVTNCDLSLEACQRSKEIFNLDAVPSDIHQMPFKNNAFDVTLCSETLEHVTDTKEAVNELLRVTRKALLITVPYESIKKTKANIKNNVPHAHINSFNLDSFSYLEQYGYKVRALKMISPLSKVTTVLAEGALFNFDEIACPKIFIRAYNLFVPTLRKLIGIRLTSWFIDIDTLFCKLFLCYNAILYIIVRDAECYQNKTNDVSAANIININVPYHYLNHENA